MTLSQLLALHSESLASSFEAAGPRIRKYMADLREKCDAGELVAADIDELVRLCARVDALATPPDDAPYVDAGGAHC